MSRGEVTVIIQWTLSVCFLYVSEVYICVNISGVGLVGECISGLIMGFTFWP